MLTAYSPLEVSLVGNVLADWNTLFGDNFSDQYNLQRIFPEWN